MQIGCQTIQKRENTWCWGLDLEDTPDVWFAYCFQASLVSIWLANAFEACNLGFIVQSIDYNLQAQNAFGLKVLSVYAIALAASIRLPNFSSRIYYTVVNVCYMTRILIIHSACIE